MADVVGEIRYDASINTAGLARDAAVANKIVGEMADVGGESLSAYERKASQTWANVGSIFKLGAKTAGLAAAVGFGIAVKSSGDYESSLSELRYASNATGAEMELLSKKARDLGKDTSLAGVTASDAARTMVELSKAGLSVTDTMGAIRGTMSLAKAGELDFADAAIISASALNAFQLEGKEASKVADVLAAGANASQASLADLAMGMQQSATVAKQFNLPLKDTVAALALFANNGIKGSDAGTSLKTMLIALAKPSESAANTMADLGFNAYDAQGRFVGLREMSVRLKNSLSKLTDEQKQNALATIFGTDAFRAAAVLADNAGDSYDDMSKKLGRANAANEAAASKMGAFKKATEGLSNTLSEVGLRIGSAVLPTATSLANTLSANLIPALTTGKNIFVALLPLITGVAASFAIWQSVLIATAAKTAIMTAAQTALNIAMAANPFVLAATVLGGLAAALFVATRNTDGARTAADNLRLANDNLRLASDNLKDAQDRLAGAHLGVEGAELQVESAQRAVTRAIADYGPQSFEARRATYDLKVAAEQLKDAHNNEADAARNVVKAEKDVADNKEAVKRAASEIAGSAYVAGAAWRDLSAAMQAASKAPPVQMPSFPNSAKPTTLFNARAAGGPVSSGQPYLVGENPDGSINRTTEMFVPRTSGSIINSRNLQKGLSMGGVSYNIGNINISNEVDGERWIKRLTNNQEIIGSGIIPRQEYGV